MSDEIAQRATNAIREFGDILERTGDALRVLPETIAPVVEAAPTMARAEEQLIEEMRTHPDLQEPGH